MKRLLSILILLTGIVLVSCENELDNYEAPNGGIKGLILDAKTKEPIPLPVQGSSGVIINMIEQNTNATKSVDFYAKEDGSYENSKLFNCKYKMVINGPFTKPCIAEVTVNGQTTFNVEATPYSRIQSKASLQGHTITLSYVVEPTDMSYNVSEVYAYWNFAPGIDNSSANYAGKTTIKSALSGDVTFNLNNEKAYINNPYKIKSNGGRIYLRIGAKTNGIINYSKTIVLTIPMQ